MMNPSTPASRPGEIENAPAGLLGVNQQAEGRKLRAPYDAAAKLTTWRHKSSQCLGGEFSKKGKPGPWPSFPRFSLQFPSRLRALSLTSKNRERGKSRAIPKHIAINSLRYEKSQRRPPDRHPALKRQALWAASLLFNAVAKRLFRWLWK